MARKLICFAVTLLAVSVAAQDVGMGRRRGGGARYEAPYTFAVETPHVKWANPLPGGPIRLLAVPTVSEGRTLVELAQRLSLDLTTISIDPRFDANKWTMAFGRDYGARAEKGDLSALYRWLEADLTSDKKFDAILLQLSHGWDALTPKSREAILRRVNEGAGLVLIRPFQSEVSPLTPAAPVAAGQAYDPMEPVSAPATPWKRKGFHYITDAIPVESFPFEYLQEYIYKAAPGASVLVETGAGNPIVAVKPYGKGRVVAFGYRNAGLSWSMPMTAQGFVSDSAWEHFYALLCRALIYAAGREPSTPFEPSQWRLKTADGALKQSGKGKAPRFSKLVPGRYFVEEQSEADWKISTIDVSLPCKIENLKTRSEVISEGDSVEVTWSGPGMPAWVELIDGFGRVIARAQGSGRAALKAGRPLTHSGFIVARAGPASARLEVLFAASKRDWQDYEVIMPWYGPGSYQPWIPALDEQFRKIGLTTLAQPNRNFRLIASAGLHDVFGVYGYRNQNYLRRKNLYVETKDKQYLTRDVVLQDPGFEPYLRGELKEKLGKLAPLKPLAYYLADESSLTSYTDAFDVDWAPAALDAFRRWLQKEYATLDALNASWGASFSNWSSVAPMTSEEAQKHGNFAPWADHRAFMEQDFVRALGLARDIVREIDPGALASISGTQVPTAHNGCNWYALDQVMDYLQPYSGGNQDQMHHLFRPGIKLTGFTGYGSIGTAAKVQQWNRLFYGHTGASIFWHYTLLNPDLSMSEQGKALAEVFSRIQGGIGRVFMNSKVREDGVAIHFSMASIRGAWITDGRIRPGVGNVMGTSKAYADLVGRRDAWVKELERRGIQFRFLATPQIEGGELDKYKVLILPYSIAISDKEARAIEQFLDGGGIVYRDDQTGRMDERCRWRKQALWSAGRRGLHDGGPGDIGVKPQFDNGGESLVTVRDFGSARLVGVLPSKPIRVQAPSARGVTYDLLRGGVARPEVDASPEQPALFIERATRIARLTVGSDLTIHLDDEKGRPVDRSVVRVEVFDPAGKLARHYSSNVTVVNGQAAFGVPFAVNDPKGEWRVRARDVISGLVAERVARR